ncbi:MAG TPA: ParA family protein [Blastocatellia bacterium]|nr:ParA family protein [Blastocatellia bacterium]
MLSTPSPRLSSYTAPRLQTTPSVRAKIIAFVNQKGGTGKTTISQNVAACLAMVHSKNVLCVDLDPQGNLGQGMISDPINVTKTADRMLLVPKPRVSEYIIPLRPGLDLIPNRYQKDLHDNVEKMPYQTNLLRERLDIILPHYDFVILDTPAGLGVPTRVAIEAADEVVIVMSCGMYALRGTAAVLEGIDELFSSSRRKPPVLRVILNNFDDRRRFDRGFRREAAKLFGDKLFETYIRTNIRIAEAAAHSQAVIEYQETCLGATDFKRLSREMLGLPAVENVFEDEHSNQRIQGNARVFRLVS